MSQVRWHLPGSAAIACIALIGCATEPAPTSRSPELQKLYDNEAQAIALLRSGEIRAGQSLEDLLRLCKPYQIDFAESYAFVEFFEVPNLHGLSLVAIDGKLASARSWDCERNEYFFDTMTNQQRSEYVTVYAARLLER